MPVVLTQIQEMIDQLVFHLKWDAAHVEDLDIDQIRHWFKRAVEYYKRQAE